MSYPALDRLKVDVSESALDRERAAAYAAAFGDQLEAQARHIHFVIRHAPTVGASREELLRSLLQKYLPERYHVATGFYLRVRSDSSTYLSMIVLITHDASEKAT